MAHLFIVYSIPVSIPYLFVHNLTSALPAAASSVSSAVAGATATAGLGSWLKKLALRAAGEEGLAENVRNQRGETFGIDAVHAAEVEKAQEEIRYKTQYQTINCIDTSGQAFAILLNCLYLAPLLFLFVKFFLKTYIRGSRAPPPKPSQKQLIKDSSRDAARKVEKETKDAMDEQGAEGTEIPVNVKSRFDHAKSEMYRDVEGMRANAKKQMKKASDAVKDKASNVKGQVKKQELMSKDAQNQQSKPQGDDSKGTQNQQPKPEAEDSRGTQNQQSKPQAEESKSVQNQQPKPEAEDSKKPEEQSNGDSASSNRGDDDSQEDPSAYEVNPDEGKTDAEKRAEEEMQPTGEENGGPKKAPQGEKSGLDESAYEINADELKSEEEWKAEEEMQPKTS